MGKYISITVKKSFWDQVNIILEIIGGRPIGSNQDLHLLIFQGNRGAATVWL